MIKIFKLKQKTSKKKEQQQMKHKRHSKYKCFNIHKTGVAERDERENRTETIFEMILRTLKNTYTTSAHRLKIHSEQNNKQYKH